MENLGGISDKNLYKLCKDFGARALEWRRKFAGLLPEVYRRRLYEKKGFESIFVFAKKLAGLSEEQVRRVFNLEERFVEMPNLKRLLVSGKVSSNKLARIASIADSENEEFLAKQVEILSQAAVETLVRDEKRNGLFEPKNEEKSVRAHTFSQSNFIESSERNLNLSLRVQEKLLELQSKGIDINQLLLEFLKKREEEIAAKKEEISRKVLQREEKKRKLQPGQIKEKEGGVNSKNRESNVDISEYILEKPAFLKPRSYMPVSVKKILKEEYGTKCAVKSCQKQAVQIHHELPFAIGRSHDPKFLVPLCREHHELEHAVNWRYREMKVQHCHQ